MKVLVVLSDATRWPKMLWVIDALQTQGHEVRTAHDVSGLAKHEAWSDLVIFQHKSVVGWSNLRTVTKTSVWVQWWFDLIAVEKDLPLSKQPVFISHARVMRAMDLVFVKEQSLLAEFWSNGVKAVWLDQGVSESIASYRSGDNDKCVSHDVILWGQGRPHYSSRAKDADLLVKAGYDVAWIGGHHTQATCLPRMTPEELVSYSQGAKAILSVGRRNDIEGYVSDAHWIAMATGKPVLKRVSNTSDPGVCLSYESSPELLSRMQWVIQNPKAALSIGNRGKQWLIENNTVEKNVARCVRYVKELAESCQSKKMPMAIAS